MVLSLAVWFALHTMFGSVTDEVYGPLHVPVPDWSTISGVSIAISAVAALLVFRVKIGTLRVIGIAAALGAVSAVVGLT